MPSLVHRDDARKFMAGIVTLVLFGIIVAIGTIVQVGGPLPLRTYTNVKAEFSDVGILKPGKDVKENGIRIGSVASIKYQDNKAMVTMRLDGDRKVYKDAHIELANTSVLGRKYVAFDPGTPSAGALGASTIPVSQTQSAKSVEDVLDTLDPKTRTALSSSLDELGTGLVGHGEDLHSTLAAAPGILDDLTTVSNAATSKDAQIPQLLASADLFASRFKDREDQLSGLLASANTTLDAVNVDDGEPLSKTIEVLPPTLKEAKTALDALNQPLADVKVAVQDLRPGASALGASTPDLRAVLRQGVKPLNKVPGVADKATPVVDDLTKTLVDARPLIPRVTKALFNANSLLAGLAPYSKDAGQFFNENTLLSGSVGAGKHFFAAEVSDAGLFSVAGIPDPLYRREPYPAPGTATNTGK